MIGMSDNGVKWSGWHVCRGLTFRAISDRREPKTVGGHPALSGRLARFKAVRELLDYMHAKGGVWFARLDQVCDHVQQLMAEGRWMPRYETFPIYESPLPEFSKDR